MSACVRSSVVRERAQTVRKMASTVSPPLCRQAGVAIRAEQSSSNRKSRVTCDYAQVPTHQELRRWRAKLQNCGNKSVTVCLNFSWDKAHSINAVSLCCLNSNAGYMNGVFPNCVETL